MGPDFVHFSIEAKFLEIVCNFNKYIISFRTVCITNLEKTNWKRERKKKSLNLRKSLFLCFQSQRRAKWNIKIHLMMMNDDNDDACTHTCIMYSCTCLTMIDLFLLLVKDEMGNC